MKINLSEIPQEGKSFSWNEKTGEIRGILGDLINDAPHLAEFVIRPINSKDYEMTGFVRTFVGEQCSRCGLDFKFNVEQKFHDILIPHQPEDRTGKYKRVNHISEAASEGPGVAEYAPNLTFDMGEYLHEQVAMAVPFNPAPPEKANGDCSLCDQPVRGRIFTYNEEMPTDNTHRPFQALKNLKI